MYPLGNVWTHCLRNLNVSSMCPLAPSVRAEAKLMRQHALSYIEDVVEMMGNALLGRVYDLESKHNKEWGQYIDQSNLQLLKIVDLTRRVDEMVLDQEGVIEVINEDPGFLAAEAGPQAGEMLAQYVAKRDGTEPITYKV